MRTDLLVFSKILMLVGASLFFAGIALGLETWCGITGVLVVFIGLLALVAGALSGGATGSVSGQEADLSKLDKLEKLDSLKESGAISDEEFDEMKGELMRKGKEPS